MKFKVNVIRTSYAFRTLEIEADNAEDAKEKAIDDADYHEFSEKSADYSVDDAWQIAKFDHETKKK